LACSGTLRAFLILSEKEKPVEKNRQMAGKTRVRGWPRLDSKPAGFSLLEVLIAASLLIFVVVGLCQTLCLSLVLKQKGDWHRISSEILSAKIEKFKGLNPEDPRLKEGSYSETIKDLPSGRNVLLDWEIKEESPGLKRIYFTVSQPGSSTARPIKAIFYYSNHLEF